MFSIGSRNGSALRQAHAELRRRKMQQTGIRILWWSVAVLLFLVLPASVFAQSATTTQLSVNPTSAAYGSSFAMTATVSVGGTPSHALRGTVIFTDTFGGTTRVLGSAQLQAPSTFNILPLPNGTTSAKAVLRQSLGIIGNHVIAAKFQPTTYFATSASTSVTTQVTGTYPTSTSLVQTGGSPGNWSLAATITGLGSPTLLPGGTIYLQDTSNNNYTVSSPNVPVNAGAVTRKTVTPTNSPYAVGSYPTRIVSADFDNDGIADLAVLNSTDSLNNKANATITILRGTGSGQFKNIGTFSAGNYAQSMTVADVNGDGIPDLIVGVLPATPTRADTAVTGLNILLGRGDGTFTLKAQTGTFLLGQAPTGIVTGDFDGDGILDIATVSMPAGNTTGQLFIFKGDGTGLFTATTATPFAVGNFPENIAVGDFNGDGKLDLAVSNFNDNSVSVMLGNGLGTGFTLSTINLAVNAKPYGIVAVDLNNDGKLDLAVSETGTNVIAVMTGNGNGTFNTAATYNTGSSPGVLVDGDFNGDGNRDLAVTNYNSGNVTFLLGTGTGTLQTPGQTVTTGGYPLGITASDFDSDGNSDVAVTNSLDATVTILLNQIQDVSSAAFNLITVPGSGTHQIDAVYSGDSHFSGDTSNLVPLGATPNTTTTLLSASNSNPLPGQQITLTATVSPSQLGVLTLAAGDTITFYDGATVLGTATLSSGTATFNYTFAVGTHNLTATFSGDANFTTSTSSGVPVTVGAVGATVITWANPAPISYGNSLTSTQLNAVATSNGVAIPGTYTYNPAAGAVLGVGTQTLSVLFTPQNSNYQSATKSVTIQVTKATPNLTWATPTPITYGTPLDSLQLNAAATTTGTVQVSLGSSYNVYGIYNAGSSFSTGGFDGSGNAYVASYLGTSLTWNGVVYTLGPANAPDAISNLSTPISVPAGTYASLQILGAMVNNVQHQFTYTLNYTDGTSVANQVNMSDWVYPQGYTTESVIKCGINRVASDGSNDGHSTCVYGYSIPVDNTRTLKSVLVPQTRNAVILAMGLTTPPISGSFSYNPAFGATLGAGTQTLTTTFTPTDTTDYTTATATVNLTVNKATPSLIWPQPAPISYGTPLSSTQLDAVPWAYQGMVFPTVSPFYSVSSRFSDGASWGVNGFGNTSTAYSDNLLGSSVVWDGITFPLGPANLPNALSSTTITTPQENFYGVYLLAAANGNQVNQQFTINYTDGTTSTVQQSISDWTTPQGYAGESVATSTAYLDTSSGGRTNVTNYIYGYQIPVNGSKVLKSITLPSNTNVVVLSLALSTKSNPTFTVPGTTTYNPPAGTILPIGTDPLNATFVPTDTADYNNAQASTSIVVTKNTTETIALTADKNPALPGATVTFTATLPSLATGTVTFLDGSNPIGTGTLTNGVATFQTSSLSLGTHPITAKYAGDSNYGPVTSTVLNEVIAKYTAVLTINGIPNPSLYAQAVTMTITVTGSGGVIPTGTVTLMDGPNPLGSALTLDGTGKATYINSSLPAGSHIITATYSGDTNYN